MELLTNTSNKRIEYIDALRGFTMILVVFAHIEVFSIFEMQHTTFLGSIFQSFRMPLFFFISGYIAFKITPPNKSLVLKKLRIQIIPATVFGLIFCHGNISGYIFDTAKAGYWFTYVLLEMFIIYYAISFIAHRYPNFTSKIFCYTTIIIAAILYILRLPLKLDPTLNTLGSITCFHYTFSYFHFFVFGLLASKFKQYFEQMLDNKYIVATAIVLFTIGNYCLYHILRPKTEDFSYNIYKIIYEIVETGCAYTGIFFIYGFFRHYADSVKESTFIGSKLQYIGKRTLDIYLLHYFLIPTIPMVGSFLIEYPNMAIELFIGLSLSLLIIGICMIISNIIRTSPFLSHWLLGTK